MNPKQITDTLERYEQDAYSEGFGDTWLSDVGEGLKFYMINCHENGNKPNLKGLLKWIGDMNKKAMS